MDWLKCWDITTENPSDTPTTFHVHDSCEILYICSGTVDAKIVEKTYTLKRGQLVIICPHVGHSIEPIGYPYKRFGMHVKIEDLKLIGISSFMTSILEHNTPERIPVFDLNRELMDIIEEIIYENKNNLIEKSQMQEILFHQFLLKLYRLYPKRFLQHTSDHIVEDAKKYIENNIENQISVKDLAEKYFYTPSHFIARFKKHTGYTPQKYYNLCRMAQARRLLLDTTLNLSTVSEKCGFSDLNSFVRCFRSTMNITPGKFREQSTLKHQEE